MWMVQLSTNPDKVRKTILITFDSVEYGLGGNKYTVEGKHRLNLDRMIRKMVLITMNRPECVKSMSNVHIINTCLQDITSILNSSDIVLLMMTMKMTNA